MLPKDLAPAYLGAVTASKDKARLVLAKGNTMQVVAKDYENEKFTDTPIDFVSMEPSLLALTRADLPETLVLAPVTVASTALPSVVDASAMVRLRLPPLPTLPESVPTPASA